MIEEGVLVGKPTSSFRVVVFECGHTTTFYPIPNGSLSLEKVQRDGVENLHNRICHPHGSTRCYSREIMRGHGDYFADVLEP